MHPARVYYVFSVLSTIGFAFCSTSYAIFLRQIGLTLSDISLVNILFWGIAIFSELPTGMVADARSRAWSLRIGTACGIVSFSLYFFVTGLAGALLAEGIMGIGMAFCSGAEQAWITDALGKRGEFHLVRRVFATSGLLRGFTVFVGGVLGAFVYDHSPRAIWLPGIAASVCCLLLLANRMNGDGEPEKRVSEWEAIKKSWQLLRTSRSLKWVIAVLVISGAAKPLDLYWQIFVTTQFTTIHISWIWVVMYGSMIPSAWVIRRLPGAIRKEELWIVGSLLAGGGGLFIITALGGTTPFFCGIVLYEFSRGAFVPLTEAFIQHRVESSYRATFGSLQAFLGRGGFLLSTILVWLGTRGRENTVEMISMTWIVSAMVIIVGCLALFLLRPRSGQI